MSRPLITGQAVRRGNRSLIVHPRRIVITVVLLVLAIALGLYAMTVGTLPISVGDVIGALTGSNTDTSAHIVQNVRLPRVISGVFAGAALGASGAVFQSVARNALGSPEIIGFTTGSATGALVQIIVFNGSPEMVALSAVIGGVLTAAIVYLLSRMDGTTGGYRLILTGIGVGATLNAVNGLLLVKGDLDRSISANFWLAGSLNARTWLHALPVLIGVLVLIPMLILLTRGLSIIEMGDDLSAQLGVRVERVRLGAIFIAVLLAALATAAVGPIAFVALAAPQIVVRLTHSTAVPVVGAAAMGAFILIAADLITQLLPISFVVPIGRMTGVIGGVYLIWLLTRGPAR